MTTTVDVSTDLSADVSDDLSDDLSAADLSVDTAPTQDVRLNEAARRLGRRRLTEDPQRLLLLGGGLLVAVGIAAIALGYWGTAHTGRLFLQVPYVMSGGILGLALVFAGGFAYFAAWLTSLVREHRALADRLDHQTEVMAAALERIERALTNPAAPIAGLVMTPAGQLAHQPDCPMVAGRDDVRPVPAGADVGRCKICS